MASLASPGFVKQTEAGCGEPRLRRQKGIGEARTQFHGLQQDLVAAVGIEIAHGIGQMKQGVEVGCFETGGAGSFRRSLIGHSGIRHLAESIMQVADALQNLNLQLRAYAGGQCGNEFEGVPQNLNRIAMGAAAG
jgi:hypothetical protein